MECTFTWFVENYSYCFLENAEGLRSPEFSANGLENTAWRLCLEPVGATEESKVNISLSLHRAHDDGPPSINIKYELSFLREDGLVLLPFEYVHEFKKGLYRKITSLISRRLPNNIQQDTIIVRCKISLREGDIQFLRTSSARTRIGIEHVSFVHVVEDFSTLKPDQKMSFKVPSPKECLNLNLYLADSACCDGRLVVEIEPLREGMILTKCKISLLDASGNAKMCGEHDNRYERERKEIIEIPLLPRMIDIMNRREEYMPNNKLSLLCELTFYTGEEIEKIERTINEIPSMVFHKREIDDSSNYGLKVSEKISAHTSLGQELARLYNKRFLTDVILKAKTKCFRAHKFVLCSRSTVFKAMLVNEVKDKNTDCILLDDLEDYAADKFLRFLYSDKLENVSWESAMRLHYAAHKYGVQKLKTICSSILLDNIKTSNAVQLHRLAVDHNDSELRKAVAYFILKYEVYDWTLEEWKKLIQSEPSLVSTTLCQRCIRNN